MKKIILILIFAFIATTNCYAYTYNDVSLDTSELELYITEVFPELDVQDIFEKLTLGDIKAVVCDMYNYFVDNIKSLIGYHKNIMFTLFSLCIASALLYHLSVDDKHNSEVILLCAIALVLSKFYINIYLSANHVISNICNI